MKTKNDNEETELLNGNSIFSPKQEAGTIIDTLAEFERIDNAIGDGWHVLTCIGTGGFGNVYKIRREAYGVEQVEALKVITIPHSPVEINELLSEGHTRDSLRAFFYNIVENTLREIKVFTKLNGNTNIVSYEDHKVIEHDDGISWDILIRMELLTPIDEYVRNHSMMRDDVIQLGIDICNALTICEKEGIIHRDIKPANIFVSKRGDYKLGDFGIAKISDNSIISGTRVGTPTYMAPEIYSGESYGKEVDIYSLGLVLYRFLNRQHMPFDELDINKASAEKKQSAMVRRFSGEMLPPPIDADADLAEVVLKACAYDPRIRYASAGDLANDLRAVLSGEYKIKQAKHLFDLKRCFIGLAAVSILSACVIFGFISDNIKNLQKTDNINVPVPDKYEGIVVEEPVVEADERVSTISDTGKIPEGNELNQNNETAHTVYSEYNHINQNPKQIAYIRDKSFYYLSDVTNKNTEEKWICDINVPDSLDTFYEYVSFSYNAEWFAFLDDYSDDGKTGTLCLVRIQDLFSGEYDRGEAVQKAVSNVSCDFEDRNYYLSDEGVLAVLDISGTLHLYSDGEDRIVTEDVSDFRYNTDRRELLVLKEERGDSTYELYSADIGNPTNLTKIATDVAYMLEWNYADVVTLDESGSLFYISGGVPCRISDNVDLTYSFDTSSLSGTWYTVRGDDALGADNWDVRYLQSGEDHLIAEDVKSYIFNGNVAYYEVKSGDTTKAFIQIGDGTPFEMSEYASGIYVVPIPGTENFALTVFAKDHIHDPICFFVEAVDGDIVNMSQVSKSAIAFSTDQYGIYFFSYEEGNYLGGEGIGELHRFGYDGTDLLIASTDAKIKLAEVEVTSEGKAYFIGNETNPDGSHPIYVSEKGIISKITDGYAVSCADQDVIYVCGEYGALSVVESGDKVRCLSDYYDFMFYTFGSGMRKFIGESLWNQTITSK